MLVLSRKKNERVKICDDIEVQVLEIVGNRVRIGVRCPRDVSVMRSELLLTCAAAQGAPAPQFAVGTV